MLVKMKKLNVLGLIEEKKKVLDTLRSTGCFELSAQSKNVEGLSFSQAPIHSKERESMHQRLHSLDTAIALIETSKSRFLDEYKLLNKLYKKGDADKTSLVPLKEKKQFFFYREGVEPNRLNEVGERGDKIYSFALKTIENRERIEEVNREIENNKTEISRLVLYKNVDVKLCDVAETKHIFMLLGVVKRKDIKKVVSLFSDKKDYCTKSFEGNKTQSILYILAPISEKQEIVDSLQAFRFEECGLKHEYTPIDAINNLREQNNALHHEKLGILHEMMTDKKGLEDLKLYYDFITLELELFDAQNAIGETKRTFCIEGWIPAENADEIVKKVKSVSVCVECEVVDAKEGVEPPTLTRSNALVTPYEAITNMYSPPSPYEKDPNPFVAIFFFIFFGIMIGDAVYGLLLFGLTFILMRSYKMDTSMKKLMMILCMGGVSALIWGAVYNSWAAVGLPYNPIINPVEQPFDFLILSLGFGYAQIMFGFLLKLIANLRAKDYVSALADSGWKLIIMIGGLINIPIVLSTFDSHFMVIALPKIPEIVSYIGIGMIFLGLLGMVLTGGRQKPKIAGKIMSGIGSWYDLVGILSDILSYCRLFGLALSGAIIGMVANILAKDVLFNIPVVGYGLGIAVAVFFHVFNLGLATLGAYVHNSRLQFVEFFGKFYSGGGKLFKPMGHCTKYTNIQ